MTCREFQHLWGRVLWTRRASDELPAAARDHLTACPDCGASLAADRAADRALRRLRAAPPLPDAGAAWAMLQRAMTERPRRHAAAHRIDLRMPRRILAVDDERHVVRLVELNLVRAGYEVLTAFDGREALQKVAAARPDMVVLDVIMPHMDGFEVLRNLKADPATAGIPVIMISARARNADVSRGWQSGVDCYLDKPFNPLDLLLYVRRVFDTHAAREARHTTI